MSDKPSEQPSDKASEKVSEKVSEKAPVEPPEGPPSLDELDASEIFERMFSGVAGWQAVFLIAATFVLSMWNLDVVRRAVFGLARGDRLARAEEALGDPDDEIAARACFDVLTEGDGAIPYQLEQTLYARPQVAFDCLEEATAVIDERRQAEQAARDEPTADQRNNPFYRQEHDLVPRHQLIASTLGRRWMTDLMEGTDNACQTAYNARRAMLLAKLDPTYRLMSCAVGADAEQVRQCCVTQLGGREKLVELLDHPEIAPVREATYDLRALVGSAFPSVPLASELLGRWWQHRWQPAPEAPMQPALGVEEGGGERFEDLQFDVQDWVIGVGCRVHQLTPARRQMAGAFVPLVESKGCAPTDPPWAGMYSVDSWSQMCLGMYAYRRKLAYTPRESLCGALTDATVGQTIGLASLVVGGAVGTARLSPGVERDDLELVGDRFGSRLFGYRYGEPKEEHEEPESNWKGDGMSSPMGGF